MKLELALLLLVAVWCASPIAGAQTPPVDGFQMLAPAVRAEAYSCVDPYGPLARRLQDEPCRWPMYQLPSAACPGSNEPLTFPKYAQPPAGPQAGHAMFWRLPVQPRGPFDAPRHSFH